MATRLIAHYIQKEQKHGEKAVVHPRDSLIPQSPEADTLIQELRHAVTRGNPVAGRFTQPAGEKPPFQQRVSRYLRKRTDADFISYSLDSVNLLAEELSKEPFATGGYAVFVEHEHAGEDFLLVVLVSTRRRASFDEHINLIAAITLDIENLRHAGRIREKGVAKNEDGVVHYVARSSEGLYFQSFLGCEPVTDPSAQGAYLNTALRVWADSQSMDTPTRESMMQKTYSYWQDCKKSGKPMILTALANILQPEKPELILAHLGKEDTQLAGEFSPPPTNVMRRFVKFAFDQQGLKIEFDRTDWLDNVSVTGTTVTIKHAPADLVARIAEEKHGGN